MARKITVETSKASNKQKCLRCKYEKSISRDYYKSSSRNFDGRFPWCKDCLKDILADMIKCPGNGVFEIGFLYFCRAMDIPYYYNKADSIEDKSPGAFLGKYFSKITSAKLNTEACFADGDIRCENDIKAIWDVMNITGDTDKDGNHETDFCITEEMEKLWRNPMYKGNPMYFEILWEHYTELNTRFPEADEKQRIHFPRLADLYLKMEIASWDSTKIDDYKKLCEMYMKVFDAAGLSAKNEKKKEDMSTAITTIVSMCESDGFIEPWDFVKPYDHRRDDVYFAELDMLNAYLENNGSERLNELPRYFKHEIAQDRYTDKELREAEVIDIEHNMEEIIKEAEEANAAERERREKQCRED